MVVRLAPVLVGLAVLGAAGEASATKCRRALGEDAKIRLIGVFEGGQRATGRTGLPRFDEVGGGDLGLVLVADGIGEHWFRMDRPLAPMWGLIAGLRANAERFSRGSVHCSGLPYESVLPGHYVVEVDEDEPPPRGGFVPTAMIVAPGRDRVELRYRLGERRLRAVYRVECAYFEDDRVCAPSLPTPDLAGDLAWALARPPLGEDADYGEVLGWMLGEEEWDDEDGAEEEGEAWRLRKRRPPPPPDIVALDLPLWQPTRARRTAAARGRGVQGVRRLGWNAPEDPPASAGRLGVIEPAWEAWCVVLLAARRRTCPCR